MTDAEWLNESEARAWRGHVTFSQALSTQLERDLIETSGLSHPDYAVLVTLSEEKTRQIRMTEIARRMSWSKSRLSHQVSRMEKRGLVARSSCDTDGRGAWLSLTPQGLAAIEAAAPFHVASVRRNFLDHLTPEQIEQLGDIYETVLDYVMGTTTDVPDDMDRDATECDAALAISLEPNAD